MGCPRSASTSVSTSYVANCNPTTRKIPASSGVGKAAAWALANELGCDSDWGGVIEIPSGTQDGRAVENLLRRMHLRPMAGSGWKVVIIKPGLTMPWCQQQKQGTPPDAGPVPASGP